MRIFDPAQRAPLGSAKGAKTIVTWARRFGCRRVRSVSNYMVAQLAAFTLSFVEGLTQPSPQKLIRDSGSAAPNARKGKLCYFILKPSTKNIFQFSGK